MNNAVINEAEHLSAHLIDVEWEWIPDASPDSEAGRIATIEWDIEGQPELHDVIEADEAGNLIVDDAITREFLVAAPRLVRGLLGEVARLRDLNAEMARMLKAQHEGAKRG